MNAPQHEYNPIRHKTVLIEDLPNRPTDMDTAIAVGEG
jgi:hypothetical protein